MSYHSIGESLGQSYDRAVFIRDAKVCTFNNVIVDCDVAQLDYYETKIASKYNGVFNKTYEEDGVTLKEVSLVNPSIAGSNDVIFGAAANGLFGRGVGYTKRIVEASNFFAIGSNPIYIYAPNTGTTFRNGNPSIDVYITVSQVPKYNVNAGVEGAEVEEVTCPAYFYDEKGSPADAFFAEDQFAGTSYEDYVAFYFDYAYMWLKCKMGDWVDLKLAKGEKIKIKFLTNAGMYDMQDASQLADWVKADANAEQLAKFDTTYWNVDATNGTITWKGLSA